MKDKTSKENIFSKCWKNNWILFSLLFVICVFILSFVFLYIYNDDFSILVKDWKTLVTSFFFLILYSIFFCGYIFYEKTKVRKKWKSKKNNEINKLYENNKKDDFVNYDDAIKEIDSKIKDLFNYQKNTKYTTNVLLIKGEYGTGKTFIISNVLEKFSKNKKTHKSYYIDLSTIENQSRNDFSKYLFNRLGAKPLILTI